jgi:hypothetical protein
LCAHQYFQASRCGAEVRQRGSCTRSCTHLGIDLILPHWRVALKRRAVIELVLSIAPCAPCCRRPKGGVGTAVGHQLFHDTALHARCSIESASAEYQTTNLGVTSWNLFGRAKEISEVIIQFVPRFCQALLRLFLGSTGEARGRPAAGPCR